MCLNTFVCVRGFCEDLVDVQIKSPTYTRSLTAVNLAVLANVSVNSIFKMALLHKELILTKIIIPTKHVFSRLLLPSQWRF